MAMTSPYGTIENVGIGAKGFPSPKGKKRLARAQTSIQRAPTGDWARLVAKAAQDLAERKAALRALRAGHDLPLRGPITAADFRASASAKAVSVAVLIRKGIIEA